MPSDAESLALAWLDSGGKRGSPSHPSHQGHHTQHTRGTRHTNHTQLLDRERKNGSDWPREGQS